MSGRRSKRKDLGYVSKLDALRAQRPGDSSVVLDDDFRDRVVRTIEAWRTAPEGSPPQTRFGSDAANAVWLENLLAEIDAEAAS